MPDRDPSRGAAVRDAAPPSPTAPAPWRPARRPLLLWSSVALVAAVLAVAWGGAAPEPAPAGLPDPGPVPGWSLPLVRLAAHVAALAVVGALLAGVLSGRALARGLVGTAAAVWVVAALAQLVLGLSEVVARPVADVLRWDGLRSYGLDVAQGRAQLLTAGLALAVALGAAVLRGRTAALLLLLVALLALTPPLVTGHAGGVMNHRLAQAALVVHVLAAVLWVGGLAALALLRRSAALAVVAVRFSPLALVCAIAVGLSGATSAVLRVDALDQLVTTGYGALVLAKTGAFGVLVLAGAGHRARTLPALRAGSAGAFRTLAVGEVAVMAVAFGLAVALSRTPMG